MLATMLMMFMALSVRAQFSVSSNDASSLKWMSIESPYFRVIYPRGCDSLARVYLYQLDRYRPMVGRSLGMASGDFYRKPLPVLLHTQNLRSNGMVTWAPARVELNTVPEWTNPSAMPWSAMLAVHEGRHAAQMQNGHRNVFGALFYVLGQAIPGAACAYPGRLFLEGDAVVAETALSASGRGRSASFLNTYWYSFDNGDWRNWMKWRNGSVYRNTPDYYAFGYLVLSGIRTAYDAPSFIGDYFSYVSRRPYDFWAFRHVLKNTSGKKFRYAYPQILRQHYNEWTADAAHRAPFMPAEQLSQPTKRLTAYNNPNVTASGDLLWVKTDIYHNPVLCVLSGGEGSTDGPGGSNGGRRLLSVGSNIGKMNYVEADSSLVWTRTHIHPRWGQKSKTVLCRYHIPSGKRSVLACGDSYMYPVEAGADCIAAINYSEQGGSSICLLNARSGKVVERHAVPDSLQPVQITYLEPYIYSAAISDSGYGIWRTDGVQWENILPPIPVQIASLENRDGYLTFESDWNGQWELFRYDIDGQQLTQISNSRYGGIDYCMCPDGDLSFSTVGENGSRVMLTRADSLPNRQVRWDEYHHYPIADTLSAQEARLAEEYKDTVQQHADSSRAGAEGEIKVEITGPTPYRKAANALRVHSWAPCYVEMDAVSSLSLESVKNVASLGAMAFFQNSMSTLYGYAGYKAARDPQRDKWFHSGHINLTYSGLYPIFELKAGVNDRNKQTYRYNETRDTLFRHNTTAPSVQASLKSYVPLGWDNGVLKYGVVPTIGVYYTNDVFEEQINLLFSAGVRGYVMQHTPAAAVYPHLGIGAEICWAQPFLYEYVYGYVPGICCGQGLKLTAVWQQTLSGSHFLHTAARLMPRGFGAFPMCYYDGVKFTADYAAPFYMGDWHILDMFYCTRGTVTPFFDYSLVEGSGTSSKGGYPSGSLYSTGVDFELDFSTFFWVRTPVKCGLRYFFNGGSAYGAVLKANPSCGSFGPSGRHGISFLFSADF